MRKIDAVLLSALILYDYSAQSLVDSDIINLGNSFITERSSFGEDQPVDPSFLADRYNNTLTENNNAEKLNRYRLDAAPAGNISYHDLAKINPATALTATQLQDNSNILVHISMPDAFIEEAAMLPESPESATEESSLTLSVATATVSASFASLSDAGNIEVKDEFDAGMQFADTDADGMFDFEDQCPAVAGVARFEGCPVPDSDADGINDEEDHCPFEAGTAAGNGCPLEAGISAAYTSTGDFNNDQLNATAFSTVVKFETNNDLLSNTDFNMVLQLADKLLNNAGAKIDIYKATDLNSAAQVNTVMRYLKDLGVNDSQINISAKNTGADAFIGGVEVQIKY